ncbi:DEAD-box ATP-dependent RNA helicase 25 [Hypsizygus marmoreus]|uniref:ATP-dependent RNA helicase n=1 Tax=Hypsizygus marmoreus TaxID=39966 RepID=A0A369JE40_HYPMA|nr:DEAD-box ATP-dependent RNA helicase 25 [Hypsizygus marmoreus]
MPPRTKKPRLEAPSAASTRPFAQAATTLKPRLIPTVAPHPVVEHAHSRPQASSKHFSDRTFRDAPISAQSKAGIEHEFLSDVQAATLDLALAGTDLLVQAKTGTGKTIAFLLPAIERLLKLRAQGVPLRGVSILVLAPTRELALQIEEEALTLLKHHPGLTVAHAIGGTPPKSSLNSLLRTPPTILIATPGRLLDHLQTPPIPSAPSVPDQFANLKTVVYDEADRLLDQGFKRELDAIMGFLPDKERVPRQAMLFSATVSKEIKEVAAKALNKNYKFVSTLLPDEVNTHQHVPQTHITASFTDTLPTALHILRRERIIHADPSIGLSCAKTIVFFPTARHVSVAAALFEELRKSAKGDFGVGPVYEIHSRKSQAARTKAADSFRDVKEGVLLCSDVVARGMDFPGITLVLQLSLPADAEQYIHRLGRTARAGKAGRGVLVLSPEEEKFLAGKVVRGLGIVRDKEIVIGGNVDLGPARTEVQNALQKVERDTKTNAYRAWLGYYNSHARLMGWTKEDLVSQGGEYVRKALGWGREAGAVSLEGDVASLPEMDPRTVGKMGLRGVPGLHIVHGSGSSGRGGGGGARGGAGGRGGARGGGGGRGGDGGRNA